MPSMGRTALAACILVSLVIFAASSPEESECDRPKDISSFWSWNSDSTNSEDDFPSLVVANVKRYLRWGQKSWAQAKTEAVANPKNATWSWKNSSIAQATRAITAKGRAFLAKAARPRGHSMARKVQYWLQAWNVSNNKQGAGLARFAGEQLPFASARGWLQSLTPRVGITEKRRTGVSEHRPSGVSEKRKAGVSVPRRTGLYEVASAGLSEAALTELARQTVRENKRRKRVGVYRSYNSDSLRELSVHELKRAMAWHGAACDNCVEKADLVDAIIASRPPAKTSSSKALQRMPSRALQTYRRMDMEVVPKVVTLDDERMGRMEALSNRMVHEYRELREKQHELHGKRTEVLWGKMVLEQEARAVALNRSASIEAVRRDGEARCNTLENALDSVTGSLNVTREQYHQTREQYSKTREQYNKDVEWLSQALRSMTVAHNNSRLHHMHDVQWLESALESMTYLHNNSRQQHSRDVEWLQSTVYSLKQKDMARLRDVANAWLVSCAVALLLCLGLAFQLASCAPGVNEDLEESSGPGLAHAFELLQPEEAMEEVEPVASLGFGPVNKPTAHEEVCCKEAEAADDALDDEWTNIETADANDEVDEYDMAQIDEEADEPVTRELDECDPCHWETL